MERRIKSPETGRPIKVGGPTYNRLMKEGKLLPKAKERSLAKTLKSLPATRKARKGKLEKQRSKAVEGRGFSRQQETTAGGDKLLGPESQMLHRHELLAHLARDLLGARRRQSKRDDRGRRGRRDQK